MRGASKGVGEMFQHIGKRTKYMVNDHITVTGYTDTKNQRHKTRF